MKKKKDGFTLAEALVALLIASLLIAAMIPVLTKKHRKVETHGKWECTYNNGNTVSRTYTNGIPGEWENSSCTFSPPAGAENFRVTVVGGGGGGAGGTGGRFRKVLSVKDNGAYVVTAPRDGTYYIALQGGGGAGGGMACGTPENIDYESSIDSYFPHQYTGYGTIANPGTVDFKDDTFDYSVLYSNTLSDIKPYLQDSSYSYCFTRDGWKEWDFTNPENCWNWPGQGAYAGQSSERTVDLQRTQSLMVYVGKGGTAGVSQLGGQLVGSMGSAGETSYTSLGDSASGAQPGNYRYRTTVSYKDVPVKNCKNVVVDKQRTEIETTYHSCLSEISNLSVDGSGSNFYCTTDTCKAACAAQNSGCAIYGTAGSSYCYGHYNTEEEKIVNYQVVEVDETTCQRAYRRISNWLPACVSSLNGSGPQPSLGITADEPQLANATSEDDEGETETIGGSGSGGWGAGQHTYLDENGNKSYLGESGLDGSAEVYYTEFAGGGGGEAGRMVTSIFKKLTRTRAYPGYGGAGSAADSGESGTDGGDSSFGDLLYAEGGRGGKPEAVKSGLIESGLKAYFPGGNGGYAPLYANIGGHGECAYGGKNSGRTSDDGMDAFTPLSALNVMTKGVIQFYMLCIQYGYVQPWGLDFFGGSEGDMTYGAGGGGGAGGGRRGTMNHDVTYAGNGGDGAAGIVIVEW